MTTFGLITEGYTDQLLLEGVLEGLLNAQDDDLRVNYISPVWDETDAAQGQKAGWYQVFEYCKYVENLSRDLQYNDYLIIQIDTDVSEDIHYDIPQKNNGNDLSPEELIDCVIAKFQNLIGEPLFTEYGERIIFAISVHSIECWLLPIFGNNPAEKKKTVNCLKTLNRKLNAKHGFTIDQNNKSAGDYYEKLAGYFANKKRNALIQLGSHNPSFHIFLSKLCMIFPDPLQDNPAA